MVESSVVGPAPAGLIESNYPEAPGVEEVLERLGERHGFVVEGASGLKPFFRWVERRREVVIPRRSYRYVTELHIVIPHLNVHIVDTRSRWIVIDSPGEGGEYERLEVMPWAPYPGSIKDVAFGRWLRGE